MIDANDDLALPIPPYRVIAVVPVHERLELLPHTIKRLLHKNGCWKVICIGDGLKEKAICMEAGGEWVGHQNKPLGAKWNAGFQAAKYYRPDAVLYVGSSDWLSNNWITIMKPYVDIHQMAGVPGCYFLDIAAKHRLVYWSGYKGSRIGETIGIGRMISRKLMDGIGWKPFDDTKDNSMDRCMKDKCKLLGVDDYHVVDDRLKALSISTDKWVNKHIFNHHWTNVIPSKKISDLDTDQFLVEHFPEAYHVFK